MAPLSHGRSERDGGERARAGTGRGAGAGAVDAELLSALGAGLLVCGVEQVDGDNRPAVRQVGTMTAVLAWTSRLRATRSGWAGDLAEQPGWAVADLLVGTGLGLALNAGDDVALGLDAAGVTRLAQSARVPAGSTVYLGAPAVAPEALETTLRVELAEVPAVLQARLALLVTQPGPGAPRTTVVLTLRPGAGPDHMAHAYEACDRAALTSGAGHLDVVLDTDLGSLRQAALELPGLLPGADEVS